MSAVWINVKSVVISVVAENDIVLLNVLANSLRDGYGWFGISDWSTSGSTMRSLLSSLAFISEIISEGCAALGFNLAPVWSSISLILAPRSSWWAEHWELSWVIVEEGAASIDWLGFTREDLLLPESIQFACGGVDWDRHIKVFLIKFEINYNK